MRGYFDALLRATGVGAGATGRAMTHPAPGVVELDQETRAETTAPREAQTTDRLEARPTRERTSEFEPSPQAPVTRAVAITPAAPAQPATRVERVAQQPPTQPAAARAETMTADEPPEDLGQAMVRAAMRWVAADAVAQHVGGPVAEIRVHRHEAIPHREGDATPRGPALGDDLPSQRIGHAEPASLLDATARPATTTPAVIPAAPLPAPATRDEIFDVSIGAIHVRVDAPAVQTVPAPQAPPAAPSRATTARPRRSALSRRALRRI